MTRLRSAIGALLIIAATAAGAARTQPESSAAGDGATADAIVTALYASVSHGPEESPDFGRMRGLLLHGGFFVPPRRAGEEMATIDVDGFAERYRKGAAARKEKGQPTGFFEREVARRSDCFGNVCQLFSTYESRFSASDPKPFQRGINSIQLVRDGSRWWITSVAWDAEQPDRPIPPAYLQTAGP
jgi:hypothetical protein